MELKEIAENKVAFASKKVGDDLVLVPVKDNVADLNCMFTLNEVGTFLWQNLNVDSTYEHLLEAMVVEFDVSPDTAAQDLKEFLGQLEAMINE